MSDLEEQAERTARRAVRERVVLISHLPALDPLALLPDDDETVEMLLGLDVDVAFHGDGASVVGVRERYDFTIAVPAWGRLYCLAHDGERVAVGSIGERPEDADLIAVYSRGELVDAEATPPPDDGLL